MKKLPGMLFPIFFLASCSTGPITPSQIPPVETLTATAITIPQIVSPGVISTSTSLSISALPTIDDQNGGIYSNCLEVSQDIRKYQLGNGVAVLEDQRLGANNLAVPGFYLLNMKIGTAINWSRQDERLINGSVSPDGTLLSVEAGFSKLFIMQADGKVKKEVPFGKGWGSNGVWQDNLHLTINIGALDPNESSGLKPAKLLWLDPFSGEHRILAPDFPNLYDGYPLPDWGNPWGMSLTVYNSPLTRAVYLAKPGRVYVLWDMQKKKALLNWVDIRQDDAPRWSPDGSKFLMSVADASDNPGVYPNGLYLVDQNGIVSLPALSDIYAASQVSVLDYFWSPSGRFIAFLADVKNVPNGEVKERLWVFDIATSQITDYCVEFTPVTDGTSLIWAPDETQILLNDQYSKDHVRVILADVEKGIAFPIAEDMIATGWMKSP